MTCAKPYSITVDAAPPPPAVLFDWDVPTISTGGTGSASFTPNNTTGNTAVGNITVPPVSGSGNVENTGTYSLTTNAIVPCNMHVEIVTVGAPTVPTDPLVGWALSVDMVAPAMNLVLVSGLSNGFNTVFDVPFNLPNTGGLPQDVEWFIIFEFSSNPNGTGSIDITATFTVI